MNCWCGKVQYIWMTLWRGCVIFPEELLQSPVIPSLQTMSTSHIYTYHFGKDFADREPGLIGLEKALKCVTITIVFTIRIIKNIIPDTRLWGMRHIHIILVIFYNVKWRNLCFWCLIHIHTLSHYIPVIPCSHIINTIMNMINDQ